MTSLPEQLTRSIEERDQGALETLIPQFLATNSRETLLRRCVYPVLDSLCHNLRDHAIAIPELLRGLQTVNFVMAQTAPAALPDTENRCIVLGVIEGDTHDMGKNIIRDLYRGYGYRVVDLGKNVSPDVFTRRAVEEHADVVGISTMMSTTLERVGQAVTSIKKALPTAKVMTGGAFLNAQIAREIDADGYADSAATLIGNTEILFQ